MPNKICKARGCSNAVDNAGYCWKHYYRMRRHGSPYIIQHLRENPDIKKYPREYGIWKGMNNRCRDKNDWHYQYYGNRGITVCQRWQGVNGFSNFIKDMGKCPGGLTLDRINNDNGYSPDNCRWADRKTQSRNRGRYKNGIYITYKGETRAITNWARKLNLNHNKLLKFYHQGITDPDTLFRLSKKKDI